jgi:hypothetical protein
MDKNHSPHRVWNPRDLYLPKNNLKQKTLAGAWWMPDTKTGWPTVGRNITLTSTLTKA